MKKFVLSMLLVVVSVFAFEDANEFIENYHPRENYFGDIVDSGGLIVGELVCKNGVRTAFFKAANTITNKVKVIEKEYKNSLTTETCEYISKNSNKLLNKGKIYDVRDNCVEFAIRYERYINGIENDLSNVITKCANPVNPISEEGFNWEENGINYRYNTVMEHDKIFAEMERLEKWNKENGIPGFLWLDDNDGRPRPNGEEFQFAINNAMASGTIIDDKGNKYASVTLDYRYPGTDFKKVIKTTKYQPKVRFFKDTDLSFALLAKEYVIKYPSAYRRDTTYECALANGVSDDVTTLGYIMTTATHKESGERYLIDLYPVPNSNYEFLCEEKWEGMELTREEIDRLMKLGDALLKPVYFSK